MSENTLEHKPSLPRRFLHHVLHMPAWHRYVLIAAIALASLGIVGHVRQFTSPNPSPQSGTIAAPHNGFADSGTATDSASGDSTTAVNNQPWYLSPRSLSIGGSVLGGFVIGWAMRIFVKTTLLIGLGITTLFGALSYFHVMNVDLTSVQHQYSGDVSWLGDQASRLKDVLINHLPVHAGGVFGMFMGFRRSKL